METHQLLISWQKAKQHIDSTIDNIKSRTSGDVRLLVLGYLAPTDSLRYCAVVRRFSTSPLRRRLSGDVDLKIGASLGLMSQHQNLALRSPLTTVPVVRKQISRKSVMRSSWSSRTSSGVFFRFLRFSTGDAPRIEFFSSAVIPRFSMSRLKDDLVSSAICSDVRSLFIFHLFGTYFRELPDQIQGCLV